MRVSLIIAAGGSGSRFQKSLITSNAKEAQSLPSGKGRGVLPSKLFFPLQGKPLLAHSLGVFEKASEIHELVLAVPKGSEPEMRQFAKQFRFKKAKVVPGGFFGTARTSGSTQIFKRKNQEDPQSKLMKMTAPSVSQIVRGDGILDSLDKLVAEEFPAQFSHEINYYLAKYRGDL